MGIVIADQPVALDGFSAGPHLSLGHGMGDGGTLTAWMFAEGGRTGPPGAAIDGPRELLEVAGAVVTHRPHPPIARQGGTTYTFVTDGLAAALAEARRGR